MAKTGYNAVRWMRERSKAKRGGNAAPDDGLDRSPDTLTVHVEQYLEWLRIHNRTPAGVESKWRELKPFLGPRVTSKHLTSWIPERIVL